MNQADQTSKANLRHSLRQTRRVQPERKRLAAAQALPGTVNQLPGWQSARTLSLYIASDCEIDPYHLAEWARQQGKSLFLPVVQKRSRLYFRSWEPGEPLVKNRYGIPEPAETALSLATAELDIIFLPLVGWDRFGGRLGMGGGFYDRTLSGIDGPTRVGLAYDCQEADKIPMQRWDIKLEYVATQSALHECQDTTRSRPANPG